MNPEKSGFLIVNVKYTIMLRKTIKFRLADTLQLKIQRTYWRFQQTSSMVIIVYSQGSYVFRGRKIGLPERLLDLTLTKKASPA